MDWIELHLTLTAEQSERAEDALLQAGAMALTLRDALDHPLLEPAPGETPLWPLIRITALLPSSAEPDQVEQILRQQLADLSFDISVSPLGDCDWERSWLEHYGPMRFGQRLWVCPPAKPPPLSPSERDQASIIWLDPGLAFGTGTHPTTALCLRWLEQHPPVGGRVIDYGCGSGILAIAAIKLGAGKAQALDIDPQALLACKENARRNGVLEQLEICPGPDQLTPDADLLIANIIAKPLLQLEPLFAQLVPPGRGILLSGLLPEQADAVAACYARDFAIDTMEQLDGWCLIAGTRHAP